jgi:hypothetical protein
MLDNFDNKFIEFSNSYYKSNKAGFSKIIKTSTWILYYSGIKLIG